jgi:hypothetical protein
LPIVTSPRILFKGWSLDGRYLAFLTQTREDVVSSLESTAVFGSLPGTMHFYDVETGEHCQYSRSNQIGLDFNRWFGWLPEARLVVLTRTGKLSLLESPCSNETASTLPGISAPVDEVFLGDAGGRFILFRGESGCWLYDTPRLTATALPRCARSASFSPSGDRLALSIHQRASNYLTVVVDTSTGKATRTIEWALAGEAGELVGPTWLDDRRFLISPTNAGPLLVTLGADFSVDQVAGTFFDLPGSPDQTSQAILSLDGKAFHLLLTDLPAGNSAGEGSVWLYHPESQTVEKLVYPAASFSAGGRYLDLVKFLLVNETEELEHWLRNVDPPQSKAVRLTSADDQDFPSLSADGRAAIARLAEPGSPTTLIVESVASGNILGFWFVDPYIYQFYWSPTGEILTALGDGGPGRDQALYLISAPEG